MRKCTALAEDLAQRIGGVIGTKSGAVPLHAPEFNGRERELVLDCIDTGWVSSVGSYVDTFEAEVARHAGCLYGVAVVNGTAALQIALLVAGVNANDEVLVPALTFVATANATTVGDPNGEFRIGPIANKTQYEKIIKLIEIGIEEGAILVAGGTEKPDGCDKGYYVRPTVFANVTNDMTIAKEEIFGPVLVMIKYNNEDEAVDIANDTEYGLAGYVQGEKEHAKEIARKIRAGQVIINGGARGTGAPFGGYKASGNGREHGIHGLEECLETKAIIAP